MQTTVIQRRCTLYGQQLLPERHDARVLREEAMAADIDVAAMVDHCAGDSPDKILLLKDNRMDVRLLQQRIGRRQPRRSGTDDDSLWQE